MKCAKPKFETFGVNCFYTEIDFTHSLVVLFCTKTGSGLIANSTSRYRYVAQKKKISAGSFSLDYVYTGWYLSEFMNVYGLIKFTVFGFVGVYTHC